MPQWLNPCHPTHTFYPVGRFGVTTNIEHRTSARIPDFTDVESDSERLSCAGKDNGKAAMLKTVEGWGRPELEEA
jgi:hypothetical protein